MVIIDCAAEVDRAEGKIVVEDTMRAARAVGDEERQHFVEWIGELGIEAAGVDGIDREAPARAIERASFISEAVMAFVFVPFHRVQQRAGLARQEISLGPAIAQKWLVLTVAVPGDAERIEPHLRGETRGGERDDAAGLRHRGSRIGKAGDVVAQPSLERRLGAVRGDRPAAIEAIALRPAEGDAPDVALENCDAQRGERGRRRSGREVEDRGVAVEAAVAAVYQGFHEIRLQIDQGRARAAPVVSKMCRWSGRSGSRPHRRGRSATGHSGAA